MLYEWYEMTASDKRYLFIGLIIIPLAISSLICVFFTPFGSHAILIYFIIIWSVDVFAMIGGKKFEGPKLAKVLSPGKTWSGLMTGAFAAGVLPPL
jgi:phosphatidate cytidylyltransferase